MQGKKNYQEKLFFHFQLSDKVPENNFYRRLKSVLNCDFLYAKTKKHYGDKGQSSINPVVFFKLCLVVYLENIISDRKIIEHKEQGIKKSKRKTRTSIEIIYTTTKRKTTISALWVRL